MMYPLPRYTPCGFSFFNTGSGLSLWVSGPCRIDIGDLDECKVWYGMVRAKAESYREHRGDVLLGMLRARTNVGRVLQWNE